MNEVEGSLCIVAYIKVNQRGRTKNLRDEYVRKNKLERKIMEDET